MLIHSHPLRWPCAQQKRSVHTLDGTYNAIVRPPAAHKHVNIITSSRKSSVCANKPLTLLCSTDHRKPKQLCIIKHIQHERHVGGFDGYVQNKLYVPTTGDESVWDVQKIIKDRWYVNRTIYSWPYIVVQITQLHSKCVIVIVSGPECR